VVPSTLERLEQYEKVHKLVCIFFSLILITKVSRVWTYVCYISVATMTLVPRCGSQVVNHVVLSRTAAGTSPRPQVRPGASRTRARETETSFFFARCLSFGQWMNGDNPVHLGYKTFVSWPRYGKDKKKTPLQPLSYDSAIYVYFHGLDQAELLYQSVHRFISALSLRLSYIKRNYIFRFGIELCESSYVTVTSTHTVSPGQPRTAAAHGRMLLSVLWERLLPKFLYRSGFHFIKVSYARNSPKIWPQRIFELDIEK
jgi:hypothetical protein